MWLLCRVEKKRPAFEDSDEDEEDEEDYDDYDDDLDDFIDDGPVEEDRGFNYSKHIRDIFGYDKRRSDFEFFYATLNILMQNHNNAFF